MGRLAEVAISLFNSYQNVGMKDGIGGLKLSPAGHHKLTGVYFAEG